MTNEKLKSGTVGHIWFALVVTVSIILLAAYALTPEWQQQIFLSGIRNAVAR